MIKTRLIKAKTPRARIPGCHGERAFILDIGSIIFLSESELISHCEPIQEYPGKCELVRNAENN